MLRIVVTTPPCDAQPKAVATSVARWAKEMLWVAFSRWRVEKWFERAKQEAGFGAFEVRTYTSLIRHWLSSRMVMYFLGAETQRLRGEKSADHTGAGCGRGEYVSVEDLEPLAAFVA